MQIKRLVLGPLDTNCYILQKENDVLIIDPAEEALKIKEEIKDNQLLAILLTHRHFDHIGALEAFNDVIVYDNSNLEEKEYEIGAFKFKVIKTYGHTNDSLTYYFEEEKVMFSGDFLFKDTIGRCDLETADYEEMLLSLAKIKKYDDDIVCYPGHGSKTTLGYEKKNNIYLKEVA